LHRSKVCCGRAPVEKQVKVLKFRRLANGTKVFPDGREVCPPAVLKRRKDELIASGVPCMACEGEFSEYAEIELAHIESKGNGGFKRDDSFRNIGLMHKIGNRRQGSMPLEAYLELCKSKGIHPCQE
jgi:hypothetical protein